MLDERKASILRAVVEEYIQTAQPVGSGHVAAAPGVQVSSATVRNEMAALETEGFLAQPHTSRRPDPHREGLPLLRRRPRPARRSTAAPASRCGRSSTRPTARSSRCSPTPPACSPASPTTPRSWSARRTRRPRSARSSSSASRRASCCSWPCSATAPSRSAPSSSPPTSTRPSLAAATGAPRRPRRRLAAVVAGRRCPPSPRSRASSAVLGRGPRRPSPRAAADEADHVFVGGAVAHGGVVRGGRDRPLGAHHPRAAARGGHAAARRPRPRASTWPSAARPACSRWPSARSWSPRTRSTASRSAPSACSAPPA